MCDSTVCHIKLLELYEILADVKTCLVRGSSYSE